jgi:hypothetical protein
MSVNYPAMNHPNRTRRVPCIVHQAGVRAAARDRRAASGEIDWDKVETASCRIATGGYSEAVEQIAVSRAIEEMSTNEVQTPPMYPIVRMPHAERSHDRGASAMFSMVVWVLAMITFTVFVWAWVSY